MQNSESIRVVSDDRTEMWADPGPRLSMLMAKKPDTVRTVWVCGEVPEGWRDVPVSDLVEGARAWRFNSRGGTFSYRSAVPWVGDVAAPEAASAWPHLRRAVSLGGGYMAATPASAGLAMLGIGRDKWALDPAPEAVQAELRATSGQGRFEMFPRAAEGGDRLVVVDARQQYPALACLELPAGQPLPVRGEPEPFAPAWVHVRFTAPSACPYGVLPVRRLIGWHYPTEGTHETWATWAEVEFARQLGADVAVLGGWVWPYRRRPLQAWSKHLTAERQRIDRLPIPEAVKGAANHGLRSLQTHTIGVLHGSDMTTSYTVSDPDDIPDDAVAIRETGGAWAYDLRRPASVNRHPEVTTWIWGMARLRLLRQMLTYRAGSIVAVELDSVVLDHLPPAQPDNGRPGAWRVKRDLQGPWGPLDNFTSLRAVLA